MAKPLSTALRDLLIYILPGWIARKLVGTYDFAFIAHPLTLEDLTRHYPNLYAKNKGFLKFISSNFWPVIGSEITGFRDKQGRAIRGIILFCPMTTRLLVLRRKKAIKKLIGIVKIAEKLRVKIVGLGAFVPIVTRDGQLLAKNTHLNMTTGASFSAVIAVTNALKLASLCDLDCRKSTVAVIGAGGSVGSICARMLVEYFPNIILIDKKRESLDSLLSGSYMEGMAGKTIFSSEKIASVKYANVIIVATNTPGVIVRSEHLMPGALVVDAAMPRNVSAKIPLLRKDVIVVESGIADIRGLNTNFDFDLKSYSEIYSCLAEVLILLWSGIDGKQVGKHDMPYVNNLRETASKIGFEIPPFRNQSGLVTECDLQRVKEIIMRNSSNVSLLSERDVNLESHQINKLPV